MNGNSILILRASGFLAEVKICAGVGNGDGGWFSSVGFGFRPLK